MINEVLEAIRRLGKSCFYRLAAAFNVLVKQEDRETIAEVLSKCIASVLIFAIILSGSIISLMLSQWVVAHWPSLWLVAKFIDFASYVMLFFDLLWLIRKSMAFIGKRAERPVI